MIFIDELRPATLDDYQRAIAQMTEKVAALPGVRTVYQIGGLSAPGISDIDMVVVFDDHADCKFDPRKGLTDTDRYLFAHQLFGMTASYFDESRCYTFFHNFRLLSGDELRPQEQEAHSDERLAMQRQWAREFLVRMLVNMTVEREYGIYKLHSLLLHGRALLYDLEFLGESPRRLSACLKQIMTWRKEWFENRPANAVVERYMNEFWQALTEFLQDHLTREPLYLPVRRGHRLGRNIDLRQAASLRAASYGPKLKWVPARHARKLIALQHRCNRFVVEVPFQTDNIPSRIAESFSYTTRAWAYNRRHLPHFMPLASSLVFSP